MTDQERHEKAKAKAEKLVNWFKDKTLPASPYIVDRSMRIDDFSKAIEISSSRVLHNKPYSDPFLSAYNLLLTYKKIIENEQLKQAGSQ